MDFLTSHGVTGEILVCEMKTWHSGPLREHLRGDTTPASHAEGRALDRH